jgi:hypothetical protein
MNFGNPFPRRMPVGFLQRLPCLQSTASPFQPPVTATTVTVAPWQASPARPPRPRQLCGALVVVLLYADPGFLTACPFLSYS